MSEPFANFSCLDELIQIVYQSVYKFVVLSNVSLDHWGVHVGVDGRWWHGRWTQDNLHKLFQGSKLSDKLLESLAEKLAKVFREGELYITGWSPEKGADIKLTFNPTAKRPMEIDLKEMSAEDAALYTTSVFLEIARNAKPRNCRLFPSATDTLIAPGPSSAGTVARKSVDAGIPVKATEAKQVEKPQSCGEPMKSSETPIIAHAPKGASLANPHKKARKYQALEFEDDD